MSVLSDTVRKEFGAQSASVSETLTARDRCDVGNCGAQAYVLVALATGSLLFCGHHFSANEAAIRAKAGVTITDERDRLAVKLGGSA